MSGAKRVVAPAAIVAVALIAWTCTTCSGKEQSLTAIDAGTSQDATHQDADAVDDAGDSGVTDWMPLEPLGRMANTFPW